MKHFRLGAFWVLTVGGLGAACAAAPNFVRPGENIALGKAYSMSPPPNYRLCSDPGDTTQLTDGIYTTGGRFWAEKSTVGWQGGKPVVITIDLGKAEPICGVSFNTAAGAAGVTWPTQIFVLVSDDQKIYHEAGEITTLSALHHAPPASGYAVYRFWTDALRTHGRHVMFVVAGGSYTFVDEIEVYRGAPALLNLPLAGEAVTNGVVFALTRQVCQSVAHRLRTDAQAVRQLAGDSEAPADVKAKVQETLARAEAGIAGLPTHYGDSFRAVLPLNSLHQQVFRAQAAIWRATGAAPLTAWQAGPWDPMQPIHEAPKGKAKVSVAVMQNEFRAGAFNLSNAGDADETLTLNIAGLPGGKNPSWITVHEVQWTDTKSGKPVAAALPEAKHERGGYVIHAPSGLTRQVWLTFHPADAAPGLHKGRIVISSAKRTLEVPLSVRVYPLRFPDRPTLHLGGWDYTDTEGHFSITPQNRELIIAHLKEHLVDSPWATAAVFLGASFDAQDQLSVESNTAKFDLWLKRWPNAVRYCVFLSVDKKFAGAEMGSPGFEKRVGAWIRFWAQHAQQRGVKPEQIALLLVDEPAKAEQDAVILAWARAIHAAGTGVKIWEDPIHANPFAANQEMMAACDVLCPNRARFIADTNYHAYFAEHRPPGAELAFYSCSGPMRLLDPYSYIRLQAWECWRQGAQSSYFWAFSDSGGGSSWNEYAIKVADYAPFFLDRTSVTPAKQMEAIRESTEDYEYLVMLQNEVAAAEKKGRNDSTLEGARKLLSQAASRVLDAEDAFQLGWLVEKDRAVADQVRGEILEALTALRGVE